MSEEVRAAAEELIVGAKSLARPAVVKKRGQQIAADAVGCAKKILKMIGNVNITGGKVMVQAVSVMDFMSTIVEMKIDGTGKEDLFLTAWKRLSKKLRRFGVLWEAMNFDDLVMRVEEFRKDFANAVARNKARGFRLKTEQPMKELKMLIRTRAKLEGKSVEVLEHIRGCLARIYDTLVSVGEPSLISGSARVDSYVKLMAMFDFSIGVNDQLRTAKRIDEVIETGNYRVDTTEFTGGAWESVSEALELVEKMLKWVCECRAIRKASIDEDNVSGILTALKIIMDLVRAHKDVFVGAKNVAPLSNIKNIVVISPVPFFDSLRKQVVSVLGSNEALIKAMDRMKIELCNYEVSIASYRKKITRFVALEEEFVTATAGWGDPKSATGPTDEMKGVVSSMTNFKALLIENFLTLRVQRLSESLCAQMMKLDGQMKYPVSWMTKRLDMVKLTRQIRTSIMTIRGQHICPRNSELFQECFLCFLDIFIHFLGTCSYDKFDDIMKFIGGLLPSRELIRSIFSATERMGDIHTELHKIKTGELETIGGMAANQDSFTLLSAAESKLSTTLKALRTVTEAELLAKLCQDYEELIRIIGACGEVSNKKPADCRIDHYKHFFQLVSYLLAFLRSVHEYWKFRTPDEVFFRKLLGFAKTMLNGDDIAERKEAFRAVLECFPVCRVPAIFTKALFNFKTIGSKILMFEHRHPECNCTRVLDTYYEIQLEIFDVLTTRTAHVDLLEATIDRFWTSLKQVSDVLYSEVRVIWKRVDPLISLLSTLLGMDDAIRKIQDDLSLDLYSPLFEWIYGNTALSLLHTVTSIHPAYLIRDVLDGIDNLRSVINRATLQGTVMDVVPVMITVEVMRRIWDQRLFENFERNVQEGLITFMSVVALGKGLNSGSLTLLTSLNTLFNDIKENKIDLFSVLIEIRDRFPHKLMASLRFSKPSIAQFMKLVDFGLLALFAQHQLGLCGLFTDKFADRINLRSLTERCKIRKKARRREFKAKTVISLTAKIAQLKRMTAQSPPDLQSHVNDIYTAFREKIGAGKDDKGQKANNLKRMWQLCQQVIKHPGARRDHGKMARVGAAKARPKALEKASEKALRMRPLVLENMKAENRRKARLLQYIKGEIAWRQSLTRPKSQRRDPRVEKREPGDPKKLARLKMLIGNQMERRRRLKRELALLQHKFDWLGEDDDAPEDIEKALFQSIEEFRKSKLESLADVRNRRIKLMENLNRVCLRTGRIRRDIVYMNRKMTAMDQALASTKTAVLELLADEE